MNYEHGLELLKEQAKQTDWFQEVLLYEARLLSSLQDEQFYGPAPQTSQERLRTIDQLNRLCLRHLKVSFNDLCQGLVTEPPVSPVRLERPLGAVVCFYARDDASFYRALKDSLSLWSQQDKINWLEVIAGSEIFKTRMEHVHQANMIILLCSASFFAGSACYRAMTAALQEHDQRGVPVVPILVRACAWEESPCGHLAALPENKQPISEWTQPDQAYESIRRSLMRLSSQR